MLTINFLHFPSPERAGVTNGRVTNIKRYFVSFNRILSAPQWVELSGEIEIVISVGSIGVELLYSRVVMPFPGVSDQSPGKIRRWRRTRISRWALKAAMANSSRSRSVMASQDAGRVGVLSAEDCLQPIYKSLDDRGYMSMVF